MQQFQCIMSRLISEALEDHTERMGYDACLDCGTCEAECPTSAISAE